MPTKSRQDAALTRCMEVVHRRPTHLGEAAAELEESWRRELFLASYASMRIADDLIDEGFLLLLPEERAVERDRVGATLKLWLEQAELAASGRFVPGNSSLEPEIFMALSERLGPTGLDATPWRRLALSLGRDLHERPIQDWMDFVDYCEGACIAPAAVFVYIVGADLAADGSSRFPEASDPRSLAVDLAIYSYLVHMRRDLFDDARRSAQLVLLPREWMRLGGLSEAEALARLAAGETRGLTPALERLAGKTGEYRERARLSLSRTECELGHMAAASLRRIFQMYERAESQF